MEVDGMGTFLAGLPMDNLTLMDLDTRWDCHN